MKSILRMIIDYFKNKFTYFMIVKDRAPKKYVAIFLLIHLIVIVLMIVFLVKVYQAFY